MKHFIKRSTALCMAILLTLSLCVQGVYAVEPDADTTADAQQETVESAQVGQDTTEQDQTAQNADESALPEQETAEVTQAASAADDAETPAVEAQESATLPETDETAVETATAQVSYAVVNTPELSTPDTQEILIGIGDETTNIEQAILTVRNQATGEIASYEAAQLTAGAALFRMDYTDAQTATYVLDTIRYTCNGIEKELKFADIGIDATYGVNTAADTEPDAFVTEDTGSESTAQADVVFDVTTIGNDGDEVLSDSVEQALNNATAELSTSNASGISMQSMNSIATQSTGRTVVVLDPGHGTIKAAGKGLDPGAIYTYNGVKYNEKDLTLKIAKYCKAELETYANVDVYLTREGDVTDKVVSIKDRVNIAKNYGATVLVSIHLNSAGESGSTSAHGAEVYYSNGNGSNSYTSAEGKALGAEIIKQLTALGLTTHGGEGGLHIRNANDDKFEDGSAMDYYGINRYSKEYGFPGIIVEHAYLNGETDFPNYLSSDDKLQKLGVADATGIANYLGLKKGEDKPITPTADTVYDGVDYSAVYDFDFYVGRYSDLKRAFGNNPAGALQHFITYGMREGRQASANFDVKSYYNQYQDLRRAFGTNWSAYYNHYLTYGVKEGRAGTGCNVLRNPITTLNGVDYSPVYDYDYYMEHNSQTAKNCKGNDLAALQYFINTGMKQGDQASAKFDVRSYYNRYWDLRRAFGTNWSAYYSHYLSYGVKEGRSAVDCPELQNALTVWDGTDYSAVYDYNYYINKYADLKAAFGNSETGALQHFIAYGMKEGRQASAKFDVRSYYNRYWDLRRAFGTNWSAYYSHYLSYGVKEGRSAVDCPELQNALTVWDGTDYSAVYDYNYYINKYADLKAAFGNSETGALQHFIAYGMKEGRQASAKFDVNYYRARYADLNRAFGNDMKQYYIHYLTYGIREGRAATEPTESVHNIMGSNSVSVDQMVKLFQKHASFNEELYGMSIQNFCQLYYNECRAEGVDVAVAFSQAMLETGWLKYGGDAKSEMFNFAGINTKDSKDGKTFQQFSTVQEGIRAQVQHLKAYASKAGLNNPCVDPRYSLVDPKGNSPYVEWLGKQENPNGTGWATSAGYGDKIVAIMRQL